jgi:hypothetical protein
LWIVPLALLIGLPIWVAARIGWCGLHPDPALSRVTDVLERGGVHTSAPSGYRN